MNILFSIDLPATLIVLCARFDLNSAPTPEPSSVAISGIAVVIVVVSSAPLTTGRVKITRSK